MKRILVAGVGNIFFGDDAFGVHVARRLAEQPLPLGVEVVDFGIRGRDLGYALLEDFDGVILIDAVERGGAPGTLYVIEPEVVETPAVDAHELSASAVLGWAKAMGGRLDWVRLIGCQPENLCGEADREVPNRAIGLLGEMSEVVSRAVEPAMALVQSLVRELVADA